MLDIGSSIVFIVLLIALHALVTLVYAALTNRRETSEPRNDSALRLHITYQLSSLLIRFAIAALASSAIVTALQPIATISLPVKLILALALLLLTALVTL